MTKQQHRATDSEWYRLEAQTCGNKSNVMAYSCILELRDRIKALEARNENDKEAWAAMRRAGNSHGERIGALMERIEDLENDRRAILNSSSRPRVGFHDSPAKSNHLEIPDSSLVERVADAIYRSGDEPGFRAEARAAICEVAAWLREHFLQGFDPHSAGGWAMRLEQEAER